MVLHFNSGFCSDKLKEHVNRLLESIRDGFVEKYGTQELLMNYFNLNEEKIYKKIKK